MNQPLGRLGIPLFLALTACGGGGGGGGGSPAVPPPPAALSLGPAACTGGSAGGFDCAAIELHSRVPFSDMGGTAGNDLWGWFDRDTGREYALVGMTDGTAFVDVSDPESPVYVGRVDTATTASTWRDFKVYNDHVYIVADNAGQHGLQVFDLRRLRDVTTPGPLAADFRYLEFGEAHNVAIDEISGFAFVVGSDTCNAGLHIVDLRMPASPVFAGCHDQFDTHDTQCVTYHGPDAAFTDREICFSSSEDRVEIVDVTDKAATVSLSTLIYPELSFVHQAWLSEDQHYLYVGDELDEISRNVATRTIVLDVSDLLDPLFVSAYQSGLAATDHNLYVRGNRIYESNYASGLRVLQIGESAGDDLTEIAFFDTYPQSEDPGFDGAWSVFPYLPSGTVLVNDRENGLFVLSLTIPTAFATVQETAIEQTTLDLSGVLAGGATEAAWSQSSGTMALIAAPDSLSTTVELPDVSATEWLSFDLVVGNGTGMRSVDTAWVRVEALAPVSATPVPDPALRQCIESQAAAIGAADVGDIRTLTCSNVRDLTGIDRYPRLRELILVGDSVLRLDLASD